MQAVLVGYGDVGKGIYEVFQPYHNIAIHDPAKGFVTDKKNCDILLIAFGYTSENFLDTVKTYQEVFGAKVTLIFSTVPIGTCRKLNACHSPIEGKHPRLGESIKKSDGWLGGLSDICLTFLLSGDSGVRQFDKPETTEFLKMRSTTLYGLNIEFARYSKKVCDELGIGYEIVKAWDEWVNALYADLGMPQYTRYILDAPEGPKGGHCVTANAKLLNQQYPDPLVKIVSEE